MGVRSNFKSIFRPKAQSLKSKNFDFLVALINQRPDGIYIISRSDKFLVLGFRLWALGL
jgi:hypothetical protein